MENMEKCPDDIAFHTLDTIAETTNISNELYTKLWNMTIEAERMGTAQPLGGDGSNGTTEEPIFSCEYSNNLGKAWGSLTISERAEILSEIYK